MDFDQVSLVISGHERYQVFLFYIVSVPVNIFCAFVTSSYIFVSATPKHWCHVPELDGVNMTLEEKKTWSIPLVNDGGGSAPSACEMYNINYTWLVDNLNATLNTTVSRNWPRSGCKYGWDYDRSIYYNTLVTEMDVVCNSKHLPVIANTGYIVGDMIGPFIFGHFADKYGRKLCILFMITISLTASIAACFPPNYIAYIVYRTFMGLSSISLYTVPIVLVLELMLPEKREMYIMLYSILFAIGLMIFSGIAYFLKDWFLTSLIVSFPFVFLVVYWWIMPESPRWLLSQNRVEEAEVIVQKIAKANGVKLKENFLAMHLQEYRKKNPRNSMSDEVIKSPHLELLKHPRMRLRLIILTFDTIVTSVMYMSLLFGSNLMQLNDYLSTAILSFSEIPGILLAWVVTVKSGRKWAMFLSLGIGGVACLCLVFVPLDYVLTIFILSNIGKAGSSGAYYVIILYGSELFPTPLRSSALLTSSIFASLVTIGVPSFLALGEKNATLPFVIIGGLSVVGSLAVLPLPETKNGHLPQTVMEGEALGGEMKCCYLSFLKKMKTYVVST